MLPDGQPVVTHSSGNHAQAIAYAAKATGRSATIVMPDNAPIPKVLPWTHYLALHLTLSPPPSPPSRSTSTLTLHHPPSTPPFQREGTAGYGAEIRLCEPTNEARAATAEEAVKELGQ